MTRSRITAFTADAGSLELFVSDCASCGVVFAIPSTLEKRRREDGQNFYCPNGHVLVFSGPSEAEKKATAAKERADRLGAQLMAQRDQTHAAQREAAEATAREIRLRWRVGNGVCPCCHRSFPALAAHVATKHPEFIHQDLDQLSTRMIEVLAGIRNASEEGDAAVLDAYVIGAPMNTVRALVGRGLVTQIDYNLIALTEAGWPLAEQAAETVKEKS